MATDTNATRTTLSKRAAITLIVCAQLVCCGCRAPWRTSRNDEPSLEQLLMHPGPWDAESRLAQEARAPRAGEKQADDDYGRGNPYASRDAASRDAAARGAASDRTGDAERDVARADREAQADFDAAYAAAPAHLRPLLQRQWDATQARKATRLAKDTIDDADTDYGSDDAIDGDINDDVDDYGREPSGAKSRLAASRKSRSSERPVSYRLSDDDSGHDPDDASVTRATEVDLDARAMDDRPRVAQRDVAARDTANRTRQVRDVRPQDDSGTVTYSLKDDDSGEGNGSAPLEELAPPTKKKPVQQIAHAEPIDTGAGDDVLIKPSAPAAGRDLQQHSVAATAPAGSQRGADPSGADNQVAPASAESAVDSSATAAAPAAVVTAVAQEAELAQAKDLNWRDHLREALRQLEEEPTGATDSPAEQLHRQAASRMLRLTLGELEPALKPIEGLQSHEQEFFRHEFQALYDAIDPKGNPVLSRRWTLALDSHRKALAHLSAVSNLEIKNPNFCTDVHSYGVISKFANAHFKPNQELLLYCELDNFSAEPAKDGYETQLQGSYEIVDAAGRRVADMLLPEDADICRNQRRDYFIAYRIYMPQKIDPGRYQLRLTIEDMKGHKFGQTSLDFQIAP